MVVAYCCCWVLVMGNNVANVVSMKLGHGGFQESGSIRGSLKEFSREK